MLYLDVETRSHLDLRKVGAYRYARDPSTEVICAVFQWGDGKTWVFRNTEVFDWGAHVIPVNLLEYLETDDPRSAPIVAHTAEFEMAIWDYLMEPKYGFPPISPDRWRCSATSARLAGYPSGLNQAAFALKLGQLKDPRGPALIRKLTRPGPGGEYNTDKDLLEELVEYCRQDVKLAKLVYEHMPITSIMSTRRHAEWLNTVRMNRRGIRISRKTVAGAISASTYVRERLDNEMCAVTRGAVERCSQVARIIKFIKPQLTTQHLQLMRAPEAASGWTLDRETRRQLLAEALPGKVRTVLELLDKANRSSVSKFQRMDAQADPFDDRVRGAYVYAGAPATHRYSSVGVQVHNFRRDAAVYTPSQLQDVEMGMDRISQMLRPSIRAPHGKRLVVGDWSAIEAMTLPWLAWQTNILHREDAFIHLERFSSDDDVYLQIAKDVGVPGNRQVGKVVLLALGFCGGEGALEAMARGYGLDLGSLAVTPERIVQRFRTAERWVLEFGDFLERRFRTAWSAGNSACVDQNTRYVRNGNNMHLVGPLDLHLVYPDVRYDPKAGTWSYLKASKRPKATATEWPRGDVWRGLLVENYVQGLCARILNYALMDLQGLLGTIGDVVMHTHDEIVLEVFEKHVARAQLILQSAMVHAPRLALGRRGRKLPLSVEPKVTTHYGVY